VANGDTQTPSTPGQLQAVASSPNEVRLSWSASTDNTGISGYIVTRNGGLIATVTSGTSHTDRTASPNTQYTYRVVAYDGVGNKSPAAEKLVQTPQSGQATSDKQAPTAPRNLVATAVSTSQINISWQAASDNVAVTSYDIYRAGAGAGTVKIASASGTSFGDSNLKTNNVYTYFVLARDAAGNTSVQSNNANAEPLRQSTSSQQTSTTSGVFRGTVKNSSGQAIQGATITMWSSDGGEVKTTTNSSGVFRFDNLSTTASYWANFSASGYEDQGMTIQAQNEVVKNIQMQSSSWWGWW
jgi:chitodextrinase